MFLYQVFQVSAGVNHHTTVSPLTERRALAAVSSDTMAAILDYCVFTKLVCPLPPSRRLTFPPALPPSPGKRGPLRCHGDERGCSAGGGLEVDSCRGNLTSRRPLPLCSSTVTRKKICQNKSVGMTDVGLSYAG